MVGLGSNEIDSLMVKFWSNEKGRRLEVSVEWLQMLFLCIFIVFLMHCIFFGTLFDYALQLEAKFLTCFFIFCINVDLMYRTTTS
jgi:hypothetical protein